MDNLNNALDQEITRVINNRRGHTRFLRNQDLIDQESLTDVTIIGAGGIGSALIPACAIMGWKHIEVWDYDILEEHNLSTTMYPESYLDQPKSDIAAKIAKTYGCKYVWSINQPWSMRSNLQKNVFMCPDNMETRLAVYTKWKKNPNRGFLIDMRMGALTMEVITVTKDEDHFMDTYLEGDKIADEACTAKHTIFCANVVAGLGLNQAFNVLNYRPYYSYIWQSLSPLSVRKEKLIHNVKEKHNAESSNRNNGLER